jgi:hypothetical protein
MADIYYLILTIFYFFLGAFFGYFVKRVLTKKEEEFIKLQLQKAKEEADLILREGNFRERRLLEQKRDDFEKKDL